MHIGPRFIKPILTLISIAAIAWVIYRLWAFDNWAVFLEYLSINRSEAISLLGIQMILLFVNLSLESRKWQLLVAPIYKLSIKKSFYQVLKGIQIGMVTPARTGDPIGKSVFYKPSKRWKIVILSFAGSIIQNAVIFLAAVLALLFIDTSKVGLHNHFLSYYTKIDSHWWWIASSIILIILISFLTLRSHPNRFIKKINDQLSVLKEHNFRNLIQITILTAVRYLVFSFQFYLLLSFFGMSDIQNGFLSIFIYYGALSFLPSTGAGDIGLRASIALIIFGQTALTGPAIVMASLILWFLNLGIPALLPSLLGIPSALKQKIQKITVPV